MGALPPLLTARPERTFAPFKADFGTALPTEDPATNPFFRLLWPLPGTLDQA